MLYFYDIGILFPGSLDLQMSGRETSAAGAAPAPHTAAAAPSAAAASAAPASPTPAVGKAADQQQEKFASAQQQQKVCTTIIIIFPQIMRVYQIMYYQRKCLTNGTFSSRAI